MVIHELDYKNYNIFNIYSIAFSYTKFIANTVVT